MRQNSERIITVQKEELIKTIKVNLDSHQDDYAEAVIAYRKEAEKQLRKQLKELKAGSLSIGVSLTKPVNSEKEYLKLITQFEMEVNDVVELSQMEFNQYVHDETPFARQAFASNSMYIAG
jgi:hypothetical protein